jgi:hypothetical protein
MIRATPFARPAKPMLLAVLLLGALAVLLCRAAPSSAKAGASACSSAHATQHVRACAGRSRSGHSRGNAKGRHSVHHRSIHKKKTASQRGTVHAPAAAAKPATCEDGSQPAGEGDGSFSCANGSEPICAGGAQPTPAKNGAKLLCPTSSAPGTDWSEAECEDGSAPEHAGNGGFACEDESQPSCPDGSRPTPSDDGSMLVCLTHGSPPSPSPVEEDGEDEGESEDAAVSSRVATAS